MNGGERLLYDGGENSVQGRRSVCRDYGCERLVDPRYNVLSVCEGVGLDFGGPWSCNF